MAGAFALPNKSHAGKQTVSRVFSNSVQCTTRRLAGTAVLYGHLWAGLAHYMYLPMLGATALASSHGCGKLCVPQKALSADISKAWSFHDP